jgi:protein-disulfide isomerase
MDENADAQYVSRRTFGHRWALVRWLLLIVPVVLGLAAAATLLVDYSRPAPVFCSYDGGCEHMKRTIFAAFLGISTPWWGVSGFSALGVLSLLRGPLVRGLLAAVAAIGALVAVLLIAVQASAGHFCLYCMVSDTAAILIAGLAGWRVVGKWDSPDSLRARAGGAAALGLVVVLPLIGGLVLKPNIPAPIAEEIAKTPKGKVTVVDFVDFECPFCRETHVEFRPILEQNKEKLRVVRKNVPLARIHPHAMDAARAACCGEELGKGDAFAEALISTSAEELTREGCENIARDLGLDVERFRACVRAPETEARIKADSDAFKGSGGHGLPTIWINEQKLEGGQDEATLEAAVRSAIRARS